MPGSPGNTVIIWPSNPAIAPWTKGIPSCWTAVSRIRLVAHVVECIHRHIGTSQNLQAFSSPSEVWRGCHRDGGIDCGHRLGGHLHLGSADDVHVAERLPIQVGFIEDVLVHNDQMADSHAGQAAE